MVEYIDRNEAKTVFCSDCSGGMHRICEQDGGCGVYKRFCAIPAADVVEVKHGAPIKFFNDPYTGRMFTTCSTCDGKISPKDKWCRHCGAKMDKER